MTEGPLLDASVDELVAKVAARTPAPGAGAVTGLAATLAAALAEMVARFSDDDAAVAACERLRERVATLADADGEAYERYLEAVQLPSEVEGRRERVAETLSAATDVPMQMAEVAAEVAGHSARLAREGNPRLRGDGVAAALVAAAAARSAAAMVALNLEDHDAFSDDPRPARARELGAEAQAVADSVA